jgi:hypothetical protein
MIFLNKLASKIKLVAMLAGLESLQHKYSGDKNWYKFKPIKVTTWILK